MHCPFPTELEVVSLDINVKKNTMSHQEKVIEFIKHDRTLTGARNLYNTLPNKSLSFLASINRMRATDVNIKHVAYQLCKAVGLQERQLLALWGNPVTPKPETVALKIVDQKPVQPKQAPNSFEETVLAFDPEKADWPTIQTLAADLSDKLEIEPEGRKKADLLAFIAQGRETMLKSLVPAVPIRVKQSIKLREQFPFLREENCPEVLKILVADLITAYENYRDGHARLFDSMTLEEEAVLSAEIVENFIENKQIFEELEHYAESQELLGAHPIFEERRIKEELDALSAADLNKKHNALRKNISINKKKMEEAESTEDNAKYEAVVSDYTWQLEYVKELLQNK